MKFSGKLALTLSNVVFNASKRNTFKLMSNAMLGKFSQRAQFPETIYIKTQEELEAMYERSNIVDVQGISEDICEIQIFPNDIKKTPNRSGNCIIGAFVTAFARIQLHKDLKSLQNRGFELCYVDTDGIIFTCPQEKENQIPLAITPCLGDYKHELGENNEIELYSCIAKKSYSLSYTDKITKKPGFSIKSSGLSLLSDISQQNISPKTFQNMVLNWQKKEVSTFSVPQLRTFVVKDENLSFVQSKIMTFKISNSLNNFTRVLIDVNKMTLPYGYMKRIEGPEFGQQQQNTEPSND